MTSAENLNAQPFAFDRSLETSDPQLAAMMQREFDRQQKQIELIASENIVSQAVLDAQGSVLTNKYAEGYPGRRYYGGCEFVDQVEQLAIDRAKRLFDCAEAIVQPHSGSQANQAVFMALLKPGEKILGLDLAAGGHLTHGAKVNQSGKWFEAVHYGVRADDHRIDMDEVREIALREKPQMLIAGGSAYSRIIDFAAFRAIADEIGAYFLVDMAHFSGLVAGGHYPSPIPHAHAVTSTTHKTLRGPRGGIILTNEKDLAKKFRSALFPGLQGGPLMHVVAGKAAAFGEALTPEYKMYTQQVIENAKALAAVLVDAGYAVVSGGTDTHVMLVDLRPKGVKGNAAEEALERAGMTCNKNGVPNDPEKPAVTSGIRLGTPAATTRGFGVAEFQETGRLIARVLDGLAAGGDTEALENEVRGQVETLTARFPIYGG
ncbi:MAG: serine hydroxymethyltransferase [Pseudomonadota bacterium]